MIKSTICNITFRLNIGNQTLATNCTLTSRTTVTTPLEWGWTQRTGLILYHFLNGQNQNWLLYGQSRSGVPNLFYSMDHSYIHYIVTAQGMVTSGLNHTNTKYLSLSTVNKKNMPWSRAHFQGWQVHLLINLIYTRSTYLDIPSTFDHIPQPPSAKCINFSHTISKNSHQMAAVWSPVKCIYLLRLASRKLLLFCKFFKFNLHYLLLFLPKAQSYC